MATEPTHRQRRFRTLGTATAVSGVLALILTGCGAEDSPPPAQASETTESATSEQPSETTEGATSAGPFIEAFENEGLECAPADEKFWGPGVVEQVNCQGGDHIIVTIRNFEDSAARDAQLDRVQEQACTIAESGQDIQRLAMSDTWILMVGGDRDVDFEVFGNAMTGLGLDSTDYSC